jgi:hypothetical protein
MNSAGGWAGIVQMATPHDLRSMGCPCPTGPRLVSVKYTQNGFHFYY